MRRIRERRRPLQSMRPSIPAPCVLAAASVVGVFAGEWLYGLIPPEYLYMLVVGGAILAAGVLADALPQAEESRSLGPRIRAHRRSSRDDPGCSPSIMRVMK